MKLQEGEEEPSKNLYTKGLEGTTKRMLFFAERFDLSYQVTAILCHPMHHDARFAGRTKYPTITPQQAGQAIQHVLDGKSTIEEIWPHVLTD